MQITQVISFLAAAIVGVVAAPGQQPPSPPPIDPFTNPCLNGLTAYCCIAVGDCSPLTQLGCRGNIICCNKYYNVSKPRSLKASVIRTYPMLILNVLMTVWMSPFACGWPYLGHDCWSQLLLTGQLPIMCGSFDAYWRPGATPLGLITCLSRKENESEILEITIVW